jgi:peptidoglycan hydrolase CwlO-like protein
MVRICLIVAVVGGLVSAFFGFLVSAQKKDWQGQYSTADGKLQSTSKKLKESEQTLATTKASLDETTTKLGEATTKADSLQSELSKAQSIAGELEQKVSAAEQRVTAAQTEISEVKSQLGAESAAAKEAQSKLTQLESEKKILNDDLASAKAEVARLLDIQKRTQTGEMPPGINGRILSVNRNWNFVVLNIGDKQGVVENGELIIYRNKEFVGKVRVVSTEANTCVADLILDSLKGEVQIGDEVMN